MSLPREKRNGQSTKHMTKEVVNEHTGKLQIGNPPDRMDSVIRAGWKITLWLCLAIFLWAPIYSTGFAGTPAKGDQGSPAQPIDQSKIDEAVKKAVDHIMKNKLGKGSREIEIVTLTLVNAGVESDNPYLKNLLDLLLQTPYNATYNVALKAVALETIDRVKYQKQIAECAQALVNNQALNGQWSYDAFFKPGKDANPVPTGTPEMIEIITDGKSGNQKKVTPPTKGYEIKRNNPKRPNTGDNSNTHIALLGLRAAQRSGVTLPKETWKDAADFLIKDQLADGGWSYSSKENAMNNPKAYGSMTAAGVVGLAIALCYLNEDYKKDPHIQKGLDWLAHNFTYKTNPGALFFSMPDWWQYYFIYGIERVAAILDIEKIGEHNWYEEGVKFLLKNQQRDGIWNQGIDDRFSIPLDDTCFAILFLKKATPTLRVVTTGDKKPAPEAGNPTQAAPPAGPNPEEKDKDKK